MTTDQVQVVANSPRLSVRIAWVAHRALYRVSGGRIGLSRPKAGGKFGMMRLTTVGRRSGQPRVAIVGYYEDGPNLVTLAMNGWADTEPAWWLNLQAQPDTVVELKDGPRAVRARVAAGDGTRAAVGQLPRLPRLGRRPRRARRAAIDGAGGRRARASAERVMSLLRNLGRRKLRTTLTVLGIVIGIWALVVFSSMANKINTLFASGSDYYIGKVVVSDGSSNGLGIGLIPIDVTLVDQIRALDDVAAVDPQVQMPFEDVKPTGFGIPKLIIGAVAGADQGLDRLTVHAAQGRLLTAADEGSRVTVLGADMAREFGLAPGGTIALRGVDLRHRRACSSRR